ncbi:MAG: phosphate/phosphite/phosphonate ABC transporter substrate-binding protein, partial [Desulfonatronovibrio sp.]
SYNESRKVLRAAVSAMVSPKETFSLYRDILVYVARQMNMDLEFAQRKTYAEVNELLGRGDIDLAFLCSGPYVRGRDEHGFRLLVTPVIDESHDYHSYLIVHKQSPYKSLEDLKGRTFAYTDPDSNTGRLIPLYWLEEMGQDPEDFFKRTIFTYSHDNSIMAVAKGLVDGAAVDSLIWEYYDKSDSELSAETRIIKKSKPYGIPPVVLSPYVSRETQEQLRRIFLEMHNNEEGNRILNQLLIQRFLKAEDSWYDSIRRIINQLEPGGGSDAQNP